MKPRVVASEKRGKEREREGERETSRDLRSSFSFLFSSLLSPFSLRVMTYYGRRRDGEAERFDAEMRLRTPASFVMKSIQKGRKRRGVEHNVCVLCVCVLCVCEFRVDFARDRSNGNMCVGMEETENKEQGSEKGK
jgi:hypothetical protein